MVGIGDHQMVGVEPEGQRPFGAAAFAFQFHRDKGRVFDQNAKLLIGRDQRVAAVPFSAQDARKGADHGRTPDRIALMVPGPVRRNPHFAVAAFLRIPLVDRGQFLGRD